MPRLAGDPVCPYCARPLTGFTAPLDHPEAIPEPGNVTFCLYCNELAVFDGPADNLILRKPTESEIVEMAGQKSILLASVLLGLLAKREGS